MVAVVVEADAVRRFDDVQPFGGAELIRTDHGANLVVEDFRRRARQAAEPGIAQPFEELPHRDAERRRAMTHLERRECMDVHRRHRRLHRAQDREIGVAGVIGVNAALQADLGRAARPGLRHPPRDLVVIEIVGRPAQMVGRLALGEGAEGAAVGAHIGVVDVAVDDIT